MSINYKTIDLFEYVDQLGNKPKIIIHVCNDQGAWGAGFVVPLGEKFPMAESSYRSLANYADGLQLGETDLVCVDPENNTYVGNMVAQTLGWEKGRPPIRYESLLLCLKEVAEFLSESEGIEIVAPRFGAGLAGGKWEVIEELIEQSLHAFDVTICDLPTK
jgi:O-acetyl-ADP-ribose deacetylase (regulator of RNase III)